MRILSKNIIASSSSKFAKQQQQQRRIQSVSSPNVSWLNFQKVRMYGGGRGGLITVRRTYHHHPTVSCIPQYTNQKYPLLDRPGVVVLQQHRWSSTEKSPTNSSNNSSKPIRSSLSFEKELDELMTTATLRAREISALVVTNSRLQSSSNLDSIPSKESSSTTTTTTTNPSILKKERENSIEVADALLSLTSHKNFKKALERKQQQLSEITKATSGDSILCLHSAFISVTSWLCSVLTSLPPMTTTSYKRDSTTNFHTMTGNHTEQDFILAKILDIMSRSTNLNLPLHLPLYRIIATLVAKYNTSPDTALLILDLSTQARLSLTTNNTSESSSNNDNDSILTSDFFSEPLKILAKRNQPRQMINIIEGMYNLHQVENIDSQTSLDLLTIMTQNLDDFRKQMKKNPDSLLMESYQMDEADIMQLTLMLQKPISEQIHERQNEVENLMKSLGVTVEELNILSDMKQPNPTTNTATSNHEMEGFVHLPNDDEQDENPSSDENSNNNQAFDQSLELNTLSLDKKLALIAKGEATDQMIHELKEEASKLINSRKKDTVEDLSSPTLSEPFDFDDDDSIKTIQARVHVDPSTGTIENIEFGMGPDVTASSLVSQEFLNSKKYKKHSKFIDKMDQSLAKDMIYVRNSQAWDLPDLMHQLEIWNNDNDILLTKEYEDAVIADLLSREGDDQYSKSLESFWNQFHLDNEDYNNDDDDDDDDDDFKNF